MSDEPKMTAEKTPTKELAARLREFWADYVSPGKSYAQHIAVGCLIKESASRLNQLTARIAELEAQLADMEEPLPVAFKDMPEFEAGVIEDVPGEKYWVIGTEACLFGRIPASHPEFLTYTQFIVYACNRIRKLTPPVAPREQDEEGGSDVHMPQS